MLTIKERPNDLLLSKRLSDEPTSDQVKYIKTEFTKIIDAAKEALKEKNEGSKVILREKIEVSFLIPENTIVACSICNQITRVFEAVRIKNLTTGLEETFYDYPHQFSKHPVLGINFGLLSQILEISGKPSI